MRHSCLYHRVTGASIRERILKVEELSEAWNKRIAVTGASIRERILKGCGPLQWHFFARMMS